MPRNHSLAAPATRRAPRAAEPTEAFALRVAPSPPAERELSPEQSYAAGANHVGCASFREDDHEGERP